MTDVLDRCDSAAQILYSLILTSHPVQHGTDGVHHALFHQLLEERCERLSGQGRLSNLALLLASLRRRLNRFNLCSFLFVQSVRRVIQIDD